MLGTDKCFICHRNSSKCQFCGLVSACDLHLRVHRPEGKCFPFTIQHDEKMGHFMVAVRNIKQMEVILTEDPVVVGPYTQTDTLHCVECFKKIDTNDSPCQLCGYPLCPKCVQRNPENHAVECSVFVRAGWRFQGKTVDLAAITVIRLLNMRNPVDGHKDIYQRLMKLEDHNDRRRCEEPELWNYHEAHVVTFICDTLKISVSPDEVRRVIGKMFTNCGDLELDQSHARGCGYYPTYANMNHACRANTKTFKYSDQRLEVRAQEVIPAGAEISTQYVQSMKATFARRPVLRSKWYFDCVCARCEDPTECGSYLSALLCTGGVTRCSGCVASVTSVTRLCGASVISDDPTSGEADWRCQVTLHL